MSVNPARERNERELATAALAVGALTLLALVLDDAPAVGRVDRAVRRVANSSAGRKVDRVTSTLFPLGLPGVYIPVAHLAAWQIGRARGSTPRRLPATAWSAWLAHRAVKLVYERERPRGRDRAGSPKPRRMDSYPSGHTTGITALSYALARALSDEGSRRPSTHRRRRNAIRGAILVAPIVMGGQRLLADDHWASDVAGGLALGTAVACICDAAADLSRGAI